MRSNNISSRFKISNPTPQPEPDYFAPPASNGARRPSDGPYPRINAGPSNAPSQQTSSRSRAGGGGDYGMPSSSSRMNGDSGHGGATSPQRPARRRPVDDRAPAHNDELSTLHIPEVAPGEVFTSPGVISPTSPFNDHVSLPATSSSGDRWAAEREIRNAARQQTNEVAQQARMQSQGSGSSQDAKLRNVAAMFMSASKDSRDREQSDKQVKRPPRRRAPTNASSNWDDLTQGVSGGKFAEIDSVMRKIRKQWPFIMEGDFSASSLALSLLSESPSPHLPDHPDLHSFLATHGALSASLQTAVQGHFQTFAASLPTHANFVSALERAQEQVKVSREALKDAREGISGKGKTELAGIRARERMVREMLQLLDLVDELKQVPEKLDGLIAEKRFLQAALLLVRSNKTINREDLRDVGAVSDLRQHFHTQESTLTDILVEELHNQLYLKSYNSDTRWKPFMPGQTSLPVIESPSESNAPKEPPETSSRFSRYLTTLAVKPNHEPILNEVANQGRTPSQLRNTTSITSINSLSAVYETPESDSFTYMETLLEALAALGKLGHALDAMVQRVPAEIHALFDSTMDEVEERIDQRTEELAAMAKPPSQFVAERGDLESMPLFTNDTLRVIVSLDASGPPKHAIVLNDLFWTLYSKLAAVMEGHRAVYEVAKWIASRRDFKDPTRQGLNLNVPVLEIWRPVQQEVRNLLRSYLEDDSMGSTLSANSIPSINEVLRDGRVARDKQRDLFKLADSDTRTVNAEIKNVDEALKSTLRAAIPGLINLQSGDNVNVLSAGSGGDDRYSVSGRRRTLITPNLFNVTVLFQPTLAFIQRAAQIAPPGFEEDMSQFGTVLDEFVANVFLPQLDEKVNSSFQYAVSGNDAFQLDSRPILGQGKAPLKSSVRVMALIQSLCAMLQETPFNRENYSRLIVGVVVQYYQHCSARFKDIASVNSKATDKRSLALPATWAQREDFVAALQQVRRVAPQDYSETAQVEAREVNLELIMIGDKPPTDSQLINSARKLEALGNLTNSIRWFMNALLDLQDLVPDDSDVDQPTLSHGESPKLPLTKAMAQRFSAIVQTYEQLVDMALNTLHLEVRCRVLCNLSASLNRGNFWLESESHEPDSDVVDLNQSLMDMDVIATRTLLGPHHDFMFRGVAALMDHMFVHAATTIKQINNYGARKLSRNILALQQTLRGIVSADSAETEGMLARAAEYWDLFELGPKRMLADLRQSKPAFSFNEYEAMLGLQCGEGEDENGNDLNTFLIELHELAMRHEGQ